MPNPPRLLLWTDNAKPYEEAIAAAGLGGRVAVEALARAERPSPEQIAETEAILGWGAPPGLLPRMPKLRWIQSLTAGVEGWLALPDLPSGLTLTCARGTHGESMPENILGALFHLTKPYAAIAEDQKQSRWVRRVATPLNGQTLGILGLGAIGQELARLATALGMRVIGTRRGGAALPDLAEVLPPERTEEVLAQADYLVLLLPATPETENFIDAARLVRMKPNAWLLNFGRGQLIVDADLIAAIQEKRIAGAMLDVFRQEPLPTDHPFWTTEGIQVLPHIGGMHPRRDAVVARLLVDNLGRFLDGRPLREVVDRSIGY
ncbi:D-2-hydroxyacid dehydrogenase [Belnapia sp. T6]|uniref:D-2-hydroxyacid dehydrogenase n=1 Tax=Belnapia mucosa TaxID=2804532 RepID=A0ABS1UXB9_9PROT|nr:D-2-hydroxyacid dehydrogenase [Belnapia mucosa]MBL6454040.1 D-2-hydroxyacid dehydrogenase [Belnapia mucosa]